MSNKKNKKKNSNKNTSKKNSNRNTSKKSNTKKKSTVKKASTTKKNSTVSKSTVKKSAANKKVEVTSKKEENKKKVVKQKIEISNINRIALLFVVALLLIVLFLGVTAFKKNRESSLVSFESINLTKYLKLYEDKSDELQFIYLSNDNCYMCDSYEASLSRLETEYKIKVKELNTTDLNDADLKKLEDSTSYLSNGVESPIVLAIKNGIEINGLSGIKEYSVLKKFVEYSKNPTNNSFITISLNKYLSLLNSKDTTVIYIGSSTNKACTSFSKVLESVSSKNNIKIYYLDMEDILTEDGWKKLNESNEIFKDDWFIPATIIVKNGEIINYKMESMNEEDLINFFNKSGL